MASVVSSEGKQPPRRPQRRFSRPAFDKLGHAQLSIIETALWPLDPSIVDGPFWETGYDFGPRVNRQRANVRVYAPLGFQPTDNYPLWALLSLTFDKCGDESLLLTNPNYCLDYLGYTHGGSGRRLLFDQLDRLAGVSYHNDNFYNPLSQKFQRVAFGFFSVWIPRDLDSDESWGIQWDPQFYEISRATGGSLLFDLGIFKKHTPSARQLLLKAQDRFYRFTPKHRYIVYRVVELARQLGYSPERPTFKLKAALKQNISSLMDDGILELGRGHSSVDDLFFKRSKGEWYVRLYPGPYFHTPTTNRNGTNSSTNYSDDPLFEPLRRIGFSDNDVRHVFRNFSRGLIQRKVRTTEVAMRKPRGFPGFRKSPAAFCFDQMQHDHPTPEWQDVDHDEQKARQRLETKVRSNDQAIDEDYYAARAEALSHFINGKGVQIYSELFQKYKGFHAEAGSQNPDQDALKSARAKIEEDLLNFMSLAEWRERSFS